MLLSIARDRKYFITVRKINLTVTRAVHLKLFPGLPTVSRFDRLQYAFPLCPGLITCSMQKQKNWTVGRPGNEAGGGGINHLPSWWDVCFCTLVFALTILWITELCTNLYR